MEAGLLKIEVGFMTVISANVDLHVLTWEVSGENVLVKFLIPIGRPGMMGFNSIFPLNHALNFF